LILAFSLADCSRIGTNARRNYENINAARFRPDTYSSIFAPRSILLLNQLLHYMNHEKKFGATTLQAGVNQTITSLIATMEADEAPQFMYGHEQVRKRRLACGETILPCSCLPGAGITPLLFGEAVIAIVGFPARISSLVEDVSIDDFHRLMEKLMSDTILLYAKTNFTLMSSRKRRSLE
jgi:hypothetical protein